MLITTGKDQFSKWFQSRDRIYLITPSNVEKN